MRPKGQIFDLKRFRDERNLTQKELALLLNRPQSFLSAIEHGKRSAPEAMLDTLCKEYHVDNISDYLSEPPKPIQGNMEDIKNAIINSPGGFMLLNEFGGKLSPKEIMRILEIEEDEYKKITPPSPSPKETDAFADLVTMLKKAQEKADALERENRELRTEVEHLKAQLDKRKK